MKIGSILFDLDGTIVDSFPGIQQAFELSMKAILPSYPIPDLRHFIGPPIREIIRNIFKDLSEQKINDLVGCFREIYDQESYVLARVYPEVHETLSVLNQKKIKCFLVTNKPILPTTRILNYSNLDCYFQAVISPDVKVPPFRNKKEMVLSLIEEYQLKPSWTILVGDSPEDQEAAQESGTIFVAATYGYGGIRDKGEGDKKLSLSSFSDILKIIKVKK